MSIDSWDSSFPDIRERLIRHRMADARWRSSVANCFTLLKEVVLQKVTWDPENAGPCRLSKVKILNETATYIKKLETMIAAELEAKAIEKNSENFGVTLEKVQLDFLALESSKYVQVKDVGPYVRQYLQLLAMEELSSNAEVPESQDAKCLEEAAKGQVMVVNPRSGESLWRVPNFIHKIRRKWKKTPRPIIVNVKKHHASGQVTPRRHSIKSPHNKKSPSIGVKVVKVTGSGRPGVKRCLLNEMNTIEETEFLSTPEDENLNASQLSADVYTSDQFVPDGDLAFTKILPNFHQSEMLVPKNELDFASEIEISTCDNIPQARPSVSSAQFLVSNCASQAQTNKQSQQIVPCLKSTFLSKKRRILNEISGNIAKENDFHQVPLTAVQKSNRENCQEYTALKNGMDTPRTSSHFLSYGQVFDLSPNQPETLLTKDDPFLISVSGSEQCTSPINLDIQVGLHPVNLDIQVGSHPINLDIQVGSPREVLSSVPMMKPDSAWPSPNCSGLVTDTMEKELFGSLLNE